MEDVVFGTLEFFPGTEPYDGDAHWEKSEYLELLNATIPLRVYADVDGPLEKQRQVYLTFRQAEKNLRAELQEALFKFYQIERENYVDVYAEICEDTSLGLSEEEFIPMLETSDQIWRILTPYFWIIDEDNEKHDMTLSWHGSWDVEHEFSTHFKDTKLLGIEAMGGVFYAYPE